MRRFTDIFRSQTGGASIEYALVASLIAIAALAAMLNLSNSIGNTYSSVSGAMASAS